MFSTPRPFPASFWAVLADASALVLWCDDESGDACVLAQHVEDFAQRFDGMLGRLIWRARHAKRLELAYQAHRLDLFERLEWRGIDLGQAAVIKAGIAPNSDGLARVPSAVAAPLLLVFRLLTGREISANLYQAFLEAVRDGEQQVFDSLSKIAGRRCAAKLLHSTCQGRLPEVGLVRALRRAVLRRGMRRNGATIAGCWRDCRSEVALWLRPPVGWVGVIGPDGTGKSTLTAGVQAKLSRVYSGSVAAHWRPGILGGTTAADDTAAVRQPHASAPRGSMVSVVKLAFLALDWACGNALLLRPARAAGRLIVFDRHFVDILVDPRRYRYGGPRWLASLVAKLVPSPEIWIVLDGDPELIHARKDEVSPTELAHLRAEYRGLAAKLRNAHVVDVGATIDEVVCRVAELILVSASRATEGDRRQRGRASRPA